MTIIQKHPENVRQIILSKFLNNLNSHQDSYKIQIMLVLKM